MNLLNRNEIGAFLKIENPRQASIEVFTVVGISLAVGVIGNRLLASQT